MYYLKNNSDSKLYTESMNCLKKVNKDWISLRKSPQYRVGLVFLDTINCLKHFKIKMIINKWSNWIRNSKVHSNKVNKVELSKDIKKSNYFSNEKIAIYTVVFGNYDNIPEPYANPDNCDYFVFTDQNFDDTNTIWKRKMVKKT